MAEIINKKETPKSPARIGGGGIKVKANRPVLLGHHTSTPPLNPAEIAGLIAFRDKLQAEIIIAKTLGTKCDVQEEQLEKIIKKLDSAQEPAIADGAMRIDKDEVCFVTQAELDRHSHILERAAALIALLSLLLFSAPAQAQSYSANQPGPLSGATNGSVSLIATNAAGLTNTSVPTGNISGGVQQTNAESLNSTNSGFLLTPVGLTRYDQVSIQVTGQQLSNAAPSAIGLMTNYLILYPSDDGVNFASNNPVVIGPMVPVAGATNFVYVTNLNSSTLGSTGYYGGAFGCQGTNTATNIDVQFFVKPQRSG